MEMINGLPPRQGLYDPRNEHDACGVGFVAHIKGRKSHDIVEKGLTILNNLRHRGATGADPLHGDGAGLLVQIPDAFFREEMAKQGVKLPKAGAYGVGMVFLPRDPAARAACVREIERAIANEGQQIKYVGCCKPQQCGQNRPLKQEFGSRGRRTRCSFFDG